MKRVLFLSLCLAAAGIGAAERVIPVQALPAPIKIDGQLSEKVWQRAPDVTKFSPYRPLRQGRVQPPTRVWLAFDAKCVYVGVRCEEPFMSKIKAAARKNDEPAWKDDSIELFFLPSVEQKTYVQVVFNTNGVIFDLIHTHDGVSKTNLDWNSDAVCAVFKGKDFWTAEIAIPYTNLPVTAPKGDWKVNIVRNRIGMGEHYSCLEGASSFHDIDLFPRLSGITIPGLILTVEEIALPKWLCGKNSAKVTVRNWSKAPADARLFLKDLVSGKTLAEAGKKVAPGALDSLEAAWQIPFTAKECQLELVVTCNGKVLRKSVYRNPLPELLADARNAAHIIEQGKPIEFRQAVNVSPATRPDARLAWRVADEKGRTMAEGITSPGGPEALLRIFWSFMEEGRYTLELRLLVKEECVASATRSFRTLVSPYQGL